MFIFFLPDFPNRSLSREECPLFAEQAGMPTFALPANSRQSISGGRRCAGVKTNTKKEKKWEEVTCVIK
jgi:hypothetical protein